MAMRLWRNVVLASMLAVLLTMGLVGPGVMAAPGFDAGRGLSLAADADGDGIPDDLDPDDDNDGISDEAEAGPNPQPDNGGIPDGDDDQIPDDLDPDDNNNGVTDDDEASAPPPSNGGGSSGGSNGGSSGESINQEASVSQGSIPSGSLVQALPETGAGDDGNGIPVKAFAVTAVLLVLLATIPVASRSDDRTRR
jgi:hypothetical protein